METITLGGGCFWCLEAVYDDMRGVVSVESGYMGGHVDQPTYSAVCMGNTGHAEVVRVTYDPAVVSTREVLEVFFAMHDPTTLNRQGNDTGTQYRSAIFYDSQEQRQVAEEVMREVAPLFDDPIVTELMPASEFFIAEDYHQEYFANNPYQPYCMFAVAPKLAKFRKKYASKSKG
ncbi:MAG: peptide-methionine (S)-S-oxide reductase MsrA [Acidobacteria bacterium]|nr:peptide-methionine (S)-S-oxide reductase MsrA [Acidobacteriota bacterium]